MADQPSPNPDLEPLTRIQVLLAIGVTAIVLLLMATLWRKFGAVALLPWKFQIRALLVGLGVGLLITAASSLIYRFWPAYRQSADYYLQLVLKPLLWPDLLWLGLLPGLSEELLFRGVMLPAFGLGFMALAVSSISFGVLHLSSLQQWPYMAWAILVGFLLGYSAMATGNLLVPILAHILTNLLSSIIWKWNHQNNRGDFSTI
ncbi:abortive phage infection protein [Leptolyngbya sp. 'hensonii']|uniref:CPBP family intramembrane glutamic endopeptidase n=1 Tax=Leptolyngbya sp. 'hensonii' TaxID=1922337 RepID=UPI00095017C2|nr:type II CAAX endopeptidase family protein [Leptolyngbya sp. 'hensonii']OLP19960.1 abortive phage infection protein [Leptolyngbya sp. 'hensonii']